MTILNQIWGKAKRININGDKTLIYHPLICHLVDVAAVAELFWEEVFSEYIKTQLSNTLFKDQEKTKKWLVFLAGIHDIGKATPIFQSRVPELAENLSRFGLSTYSIKKYHSILSGEILYRYLLSGNQDFNIDNPQLILNFKYVVGGHHGIFPKTENFIELLSEHLGTGKWQEIQKELIQVVADFCGLDENARKITSRFKKSLNKDKLNAFLIFIAGFISVVDWIGSNDKFFDYYTKFENIAEFKEKYFHLSKKRAKNAIEQIGWADWKKQYEKNKIFSFKEVFPFIKNLRPLQKQLLDNLNHITSPSLIIIEAPMGEGKTEAALYLEHYLETKEDLQGAYIALPTQATANQMFHRVKKCLASIKRGFRVNLHLLHGNAIISDEYSLLKTNSKNFDEEESNIVADEWFTFRKRGLISPFGVGTIDQILLSVLPIKHFFVRLFGLAGKTIIIDEVHSYDIYMSTILENLLYWLRLMGTNVILLSATLPSFKRKKLIKTYYGKNDEIKEKPYPRITICTENKVNSLTFDTSLKKQRDESVIIEWIDESSIVERIKKSLEQGGSVAIICNKVKRAQNMYLILKPLENLGFDIDLLHSRFPFIRRNEIENTVIEKYGKNRNHNKFPQVLISTQIIEQSLDLDFNLMISDLAPVDLLFQRMGRLHRHTHYKNGDFVVRPKKLKRPQFWIIKPELNEFLIPQIPYPIYSKYVLIKTFLHLWPIKNISIPDDLEKFIECVYNDNLNIPSVFESVKDQWEKELSKAKSLKESLDGEKRLSAKYRLIPDPSDEDFFEDFSGYLEENTPKAQKSLQSLTRITMPSINLVCLYETNEGLFFDEEGIIPIDLNNVPTRDDAITILNYTTRISNYHLFKYFIKKINSIPPSWRKNILVCSTYVVILTQEKATNKYFFETDKKRIYLYDKLGIFIENKTKRS